MKMSDFLDMLHDFTNFTCKIEREMYKTAKNFNFQMRLICITSLSSREAVLIAFCILLFLITIRHFACIQFQN